MGERHLALGDQRGLLLQLAPLACNRLSAWPHHHLPSLGISESLFQERESLGELRDMRLLLVEGQAERGALVTHNGQNALQRLFVGMNADEVVHIANVALNAAAFAYQMV